MPPKVGASGRDSDTVSPRHSRRASRVRPLREAVDHAELVKLPTVTNFGDFQMEIYLGGLAGNRPVLPLEFTELERRAHAALAPEIVSYVAGGAGNELTQNVNVTAYDRYGL